MEPKERSKWDKMASDDMERFAKEKASYRGPWTVPIGHRKSKVCPNLFFAFSFASSRAENGVRSISSPTFRTRVPQSALPLRSSHFPIVVGQL
jgi:hypothetical protein